MRPNGTTRVCVQCGAEYTATQEFRGYARRFCSRECTGEYNQQRARASWPSENEVRRLYEAEGLSDRDLGARYGRSYQWAYTVRTTKRRDWKEAREKVEAEGRCRVCARSGIKIDAAHIVPRSQVAPGPGEHPDNIVPLCAERCHAAFDGRRLDLLPYLTLGEQAYATRLVGLVAAYQRTTNDRSAA